MRSKLSERCYRKRGAGSKKKTQENYEMRSRSKNINHNWCFLKFKNLSDGYQDYKKSSIPMQLKSDKNCKENQELIQRRTETSSGSFLKRKRKNHSKLQEQSEVWSHSKSHLSHKSHLHEVHWIDRSSISWKNNANSRLLTAGILTHLKPFMDSALTTN